jgi:hypothetical protein
MTSDFSTPSCGQSFTSKSKGYTDLSGIAPADPFAPLGESMAAGGTISTADSGLAGTPSEQTQDNPDRDVTLSEGAAQDYGNDVS